jgi:hypothetical protein
MALTNAEKQRRWRDRNIATLTGDAASIAAQLIGMTDQKKLRKIAAFINDHLRHPDRTPMERAIALGRAGMNGLNGRLSKTAAIARLREPPPKISWRVAVTTKDGKHWSNGVCLETREEAEAYRDHFAKFELEPRGYVTADLVQVDDPPTCSVTRASKGGRPTLGFRHGDCVLLDWRSDAEIVAVDVPPG